MVDLAGLRILTTEAIGNIYSHALGALLLVIVPVYMVRSDSNSRYTVPTTADSLICSI